MNGGGGGGLNQLALLFCKSVYNFEHNNMRQELSMVANSIYAVSIKCCSIDWRKLFILLLMWSIRISWTSFKVCLS